MFKLLIVEDEPLIRAGLQHYFSWQELGVHSIFEAENGKEGVQTALRERPDLVITDIRMPELNGLDMIDQLRKELPDTVFVILTGYNDFHYAQQAIRIGGVHAFLLKPLQYEESLATIRDCLSHLEKRRGELQARSRLELEAEENKALKGGQLVKHLLEEEVTPLEIDELRALCGFRSYYYLPIAAACVPTITTLHQTRRWFRSTVEAILKEALPTICQSGPYRIITYLSNSVLYAVAIMEDQVPEAPKLFAGHRFNEKFKLRAAERNASLYMAIGELTDQLPLAGQALQQSDKVLYRRFIEPGRHTFHIPNEGSTLPHKEPFLQLEEKDKNLLLACLENGNEAQIHDLMQRLAHETLMKGTLFAPEHWLAFLQEMIGVTLRFAYKHGIVIEGVYSDKLLTLSFVEDFQTVKELYEWLAAWIAHISAVFRDLSLPTSHQDSLIFEQIEAYIKEHLDMDVTLQMVADRFFYNPSYLSRLFKKKLNKNYMTFVTEIRMRYAQECLKQPHVLITDICSMCGYKSYKHFVKTFRSFTHMTPTDYRKQLGL